MAFPMSDRCWFEVHVRKEDASAFRELVVHGSSYEEAPAEDHYPNAVYLLDSDADYGHYSACEEAAERGLVFEGSSGPGAEYGSARFCGFDGDFHYIETVWGGASAVRYDERVRRLDLSTLPNIEAYFNAVERVRAALGDESRGSR